MMIGLAMPVFVLILVLFTVAIIMENKTTDKKGSILRHVYFYVASLVTLGIVVGSLIFLGNLGLKTWVFTDAESLSYRLGQPPVLYLSDTATDASAIKVGGTGAITCDGGCTLSDTQKSSISQWETSYEKWLKNKDNPNANRLRDLINGLSFLIIALPIFIIHYRIVQREAKRSAPEQHNPVRPAYYYFISLSALVMTIVAGGILLNVTLKNWVFPSVGENEKNISSIMPITDEYGISAVQSVASCGTACGLDEGTVTLAKQWVVDYNAWNAGTNTVYNTPGRQASGTIPFIVFGIPLFWYHWAVVRREAKERKEQQTSPPII